MNDYNIFSAVSVNSTYLSVMNILLIIEQSTTEREHISTWVLKKKNSFKGELQKELRQGNTSSALFLI